MHRTDVILRNVCKSIAIINAQLKQTHPFPLKNHKYSGNLPSQFINEKPSMFLTLYQNKND